MKIIELKGLGTTNKGAHLMLDSVKTIINEHFKNVYFCYKKQWGLNYKEAGRNGIYKIVDFPAVKRIPWNLLMKYIPQHILLEHGLVLQHRVDVILDGSGFAYGDFWGHEKINDRLGEFLNNKYPKHTKLILLPQAFGPFTNDLVKSHFQKVVEKADLIYARDRMSFHYLKETYGERPNMKIAPDFTNLLDAGIEKEYPEGNVCIIPNYKVLSESETKNNYYQFLKDVIQYIKTQDGKPYFLIHEGEKDKKIAEDINEVLPVPLEIVMDYDPIHIKNRIKSSELIVVSRFHGLVSALSQGIPVLTTSWSHKYKMLLEEYAQSENLVDINNPDWDFIRSYIKENLFYKRENREKYQELIQKEKQKSQNCWNEIIEQIQK